MATLYLFNPENDLALGSGHSNYFPPRNALELRRSGAMLPLWYASGDDKVLTDSLPPAEWFETITEAFGLGASPVLAADPSIERCSPWGWSSYVRSQFLKAGVNTHCLPDEKRLERIRELSHRRSSVAILQALRERGLYKGELPAVVTEVDEVKRMLGNAGSEGIYLKAPWSSTGRGVIPSSSLPADTLLTQAEGIIRHQGSAVVETGYARQLDFAMLFHKAEGGAVRYIGLSLFDTLSRSYSGNRLLTDDAISAIIGQYASISELDAVANALPEILNDLTGQDYAGYFGVDMMVVRDDDAGAWIHPCVEINLRMTMGVVAHIFRERYLAPDGTGYLTVAMGERSTRIPVIECGRLVEGDLNLVPPGGKFSLIVSADRV
ncbi:MAG: hypothetical protein K2O00_08615 [Muribaculaceae bacterium]|nr:hypothetical protein [Muribaculaceae bacterium]